MNKRILGLLAVCSWILPTALQAQVVIIDQSTERINRSIPPNLSSSRPSVAYKIKSVDIHSVIRDQVAKVQISQVFQNTSNRVLEAQLIFPMPADAAISQLTLLVNGKELTGKLMKKDDARRIYESIVRRRRDPALLEYIGRGLYQTSVFPVPAGAERKVEIRYSQLLKKENGLVQLLLPIGTNKHGQRPIESLNATVRVEATQQIKTIYSATHEVNIERPDNMHAVCKLQLRDVYAHDDFRLFYGTQGGMVGMNVISYKPREDEEGYFVLLASPEVERDAAVRQVPKTSIFVLDRSGSMNGKKIVQAREALKFFLNQLEPQDTFNIVVYDSVIESFRPELQRAEPQTIQAALGFVDGIYAGGSTNIDGALQAALSMVQDSSRPSYVLFLTDGLPTVGEKNDMVIAANAKRANRFAARLFSFGVGFDVNSRLLDRLSHGNRGQSIFVRPNENIEAHVSSLYNKIAAPVVTDLNVVFEFDRLQQAVNPVSRTYPRQLTDLFHGEQLVWVGRYRQGGTVKVVMTGMVAEQKKQFVAGATLVKKSIDETNGFVERLWATRRIGEIIDELDLHGQNQELVDELVRLSIRHGIITPYTSFLADESVSLADRAKNVSRAAEVTRRGLAMQAGRQAFRQRLLKGQLQQADRAAPAGSQPSSAKILPERTGRSSLGLEAASVAPRRQVVRTIGQKTFFFKQNRWQDSSVTAEQQQAAIRIVQFSNEYFSLAASHGGRLAKYLVFNEPLILNLGGKIYQIDPPRDTEPQRQN